MSKKEGLFCFMQCKQIFKIRGPCLIIALASETKLSPLSLELSYFFGESVRLSTIFADNDTESFKTGEHLKC